MRVLDVQVGFSNFRYDLAIDASSIRRRSTLNVRDAFVNEKGLITILSCERWAICFLRATKQKHCLH